MPASLEKAEGWKIPSAARLPGALIKKAELVIPGTHPGSGAESEVEGEGRPS